ncbi:MAG: hypothetical protein ABIH71_06005 [Candidatus Omnitrophota bacterium]
MFRKIVVLIGMVFIVHGAAFSQMSSEEAEEKAVRIHELATSDVIYLDEEEKALYYQNISIIQLLKEIKDLLRQQIEVIQTKEPKE